MTSAAGRLDASRAAGLLLVASLSALVVAAMVMIGSGAFTAFGDFLGGSLAVMAPYLDAFRLSNELYAVGWLAQLLGFVAFTVLSYRRGDDLVAILACAALGVATVLALLEAIFVIGRTTWAADPVLAASISPALDAAAHEWFRRIQYFYTVIGFSAQGAFGWSLLRTRLLGPAAGWTVIAWSLAMLVIDSSFLGIPALLFFMPAALGVALLRGGPSSR